MSKHYFSCRTWLITLRLGVVVASVLAAGSGEANPGDESAGLLAWLGVRKDIDGWLPFKTLRLTLGGWVNTGTSFNLSGSEDGFNGPVTFTDRHGEVQLNQFYLFLERPVDLQGEHWDLGGRVDALFGTDAVYSQAWGDPQGHWDQRLVGNDNRFYQLALPQVYLDAVAPWGNGVRVKLGHFYTIIGNESVMAPDNLFSSHSYTMQYGEPFTHTGVLVSYQPVDAVTLNAGAVTGSLAGGWDGSFDVNLEEWAFLGGVTWASTETATSVTLNASHGGIQDIRQGSWNLYSLVLNYDFSPLLHYTLQHDYGWVSKPDGDAEWYGLVHYLSYDLKDDLEVGLRAEWFRDDDGFRVSSRSRIALHSAAGGSSRLGAVASVDSLGNSVGSSFFAITAGINWKPQTWLTIRPSVRYDYADSAKRFDCQANNVSAQCSRDSQWLISADAVILF